MATKCRAINQAGKPCGAEPLPSGFCRWHDPALADRRREWSAKGGKGRSNKARAKARMPEPMSLADLRAVLSATIGGVLSREVEPGVGNCVANLARAMRDVTEASEIEERLAELEAAAGLRAKETA